MHYYRFTLSAGIIVQQGSTVPNDPGYSPNSNSPVLITKQGYRETVLVKGNAIRLTEILEACLPFFPSVTSKETF